MFIERIDFTIHWKLSLVIKTRM